MINTDRLDQIEARANAATEGPWVKDPDEPDHVLKPDRPGSTWDGTYIATVQRDDFNLFEEANTEFIAAARTDVPALVAAIRAALAVMDSSWYGDPEVPFKMRDAITKALA